MWISSTNKEFILCSSTGGFRNVIICSILRPMNGWKGATECKAAPIQQHYGMHQEQSNQIKACPLWEAPLDNCCQICLPSFLTSGTCWAEGSYLVKQLKTYYLHCIADSCGLLRHSVHVRTVKLANHNYNNNNRDEQSKGSIKPHKNTKRWDNRK